ncbi:MAG TPA: hypothetical protein VIK01_29640 [Polyangiaceae bacterium]
MNEMHAVSHATQAQPGSMVTVDHAPRAPNLGDVAPLVAAFSYDGFSCAIDDRPLEMVVGEHVDISTRYPGSTLEVIRAPKPVGDQTTASTLRAPRFTPRAPGLFVVSITLPGGWRREIEVACFPLAVMEKLEYPANMGHQRRMRLRAIVRDQRVTRETIIAALESGETNLGALLGLKPNAAINMKVFC